MSKYNFLDISAKLTFLNDISCIAINTSEVDEKLRRTHENESKDTQLSTSAQSFNMKYVTFLIKLSKFSSSN